MGFIYMPNMALRNPWDKTKIGLILKRENRREGEKRRREEEEEEEKKKWRRREAMIKKVWKLTLIMDSMRFGMDLWFCMVIILPQT